MRSTADLNISFKETTVHTLSIFDWGRETVKLSEILSFDSNGSSGVLVLDSECSIDKTPARCSVVWSDINALVGDTKHLDDHLVMSDPWGDLNSVSHDEGVVVVRADVSKGDGVWLLSASSHAEDLVAVWVIEEVLILSSVGHKEGVVIAGLEGIIAPLIDAVIAVHFRVLHPAVSLALSSKSDPVCKLLVREERGIKFWDVIHELQLISGNNPQAFLNG